MRNKFIILLSIPLLVSCSNNIAVNEVINKITSTDNSSNINLKEQNKTKEDNELINAIQNKDKDLVSSLLEKKYDVNSISKNGNTALMFAVSNKNLTPTIINKLLHKGSNINYENNQSETALILALKNEQVEISMLLINNGADINVLDMDNNTPLILAVKNRDIGSIKLMLEKDVDKEVKNNKNETAISYAKKYGYTEIVSLLEQN